MTMRDDDLEAINRYFMQGVAVKTAAAEKVKQEWMKWWKENKTFWGYSDEKYDEARNLKHKFDSANAATSSEKAEVAAQQARGFTTEEAQGETRRSGTAGQFLEEEKPLIPTSWKVGAVVGIGLVTLGVFGKKLLALTPAGRLAKFLP